MKKRVTPTHARVWVFLLTLCSLGHVATARASDDCQYNGIAEVPLCMPFSLIEVAANDIVYGWYSHALWMSSNRGETWEQVRAFPDTVHCRGLFVARSGSVFVGVTRQGRLWRGVPGSPWDWSACLDFMCDSCAIPSDNSRMWKMCEDNSGRIFVGEYGGAWDDTCAFIHRSEDGGDTWTVVYECPSRHVHFVSADPYTGKLYASIGDGSGRYRLVCSEDGGDTWSVLLDGDCLAQPVSIAFTPAMRVFGSDCGIDTNRIYTTHDDEQFVTRLLLSDEYDSYVWDMSTCGDGYIYAGTCAKLSQGSKVFLYASYDGGENWCGARSFGILPEWGGVVSLSSFDSEGWGYCTYTTSSGEYAAFRFHHEEVSDVAETPVEFGDGVSMSVGGSASSRVTFYIDLRDAACGLSLELYDLCGRRVRVLVRGSVPSGHHEFVWDGLTDGGRRVSDGVYFARLHAGATVLNRKVMILDAQ